MKEYITKFFTLENRLAIILFLAVFIFWLNGIPNYDTWAILLTFFVGIYNIVKYIANITFYSSHYIIHKYQEAKEEHDRNR